MTFYYLLRTLNFDWNRARRIFYNLTDSQISWLNYMMERDRRIAEDNQNTANNNSYMGSNVITHKSFSLKNK